MSDIVFFLEEESAKVMLEGLLVRILPPDVTIRCIAFEGKQDLERQLIRKMKGYCVPGALFVVLRDQDAGDCKLIKKTLQKKCEEAGQSGSLIRIACYELESWYLADLSAVEKAFQGVSLARYQNKTKFRSPDDHPYPSRTLKEILPSYQKIRGSRAIGPFLDINNKRSRSFAAFVSGLQRLVSELKKAARN